MLSDMDPASAPASASPEPESQPAIRSDLYTAVLLPVGAISGLIITFALFTNDRIVIPGLIDNIDDDAVRFLGVRLGSTKSLPGLVWALGFLTFFGTLGSCIGYLTGKGLGRLTNWGT